VVARYAHTGHPGLAALDLGVSTWIGPTDDSGLAEEFRNHVKTLLAHPLQMYLAPIGEALVRRQPASAGAGSRFQGLESDAEHLVVTCALWARRTAPASRPGQRKSVTACEVTSRGEYSREDD
jgi:hypothetical protein